MAQHYTIDVYWTAWDIRPPFCHCFCRWLTYDQHRKFRELEKTTSLSEAFEYVLKVGRTKRSG